MSEASEKIIRLIDDFNRIHNCKTEEASLVIKNYKLDDFMEFDVYTVVWNSVEYTIAGLLKDFDGVRVIEFTNYGDEMEGDPEEQTGKPVLM